MPKVVVVGSINMDLVALASRFPAPGETVSGQQFATFAGGKGANQAVAASRLGAEVVMLGAVGDDGFGEELCQGLAANGVDTQYIKTVAHCASGVACITVSGGENAIIVVPGANNELKPEDVKAFESEIASADVVITQLEIPFETVEAVVEAANRLKVPVILNPAPACHLPASLLEKVDYLTPNEHELAMVLGQEGQSYETLLPQLPEKVVMTHGENGALWSCPDGQIYHQPAFKVHAVDTTGAGDTFNAAFARYLPLGVEEAMRHAAAAAALSVTRLGAQGGMPTESELNAFLYS